jgi:hypothetical protein
MKPDQLIGEVMTPFGKAYVYVGRYPGGAIAVQLMSGRGEPLGTLSTNLVPIGASIGDDEFWVKTWSENVRLVQPMLDSDLFEDTGKVAGTGFVLAPIWRIRNSEHVPPVTRRRRAATQPAPACSK